MSSLSKECLISFGNPKTASSSLALSTIIPPLMSIKALDVGKNGLLKMMGISKSSITSSIIKSTRKINLSILTKIPSIISLNLINRLAYCKVFLVCLGSLNPNFLKILYIMTMILTPKSVKALSSFKLLIKQGIVKFPRSLYNSLFQRMASHSLLIMNIDNFSIFLLFVSRSILSIWIFQKILQKMRN